MGISALNQAEKEHDLALVMQEASLLFGTCICAHTIKKGTRKQLFFYGAVQSSMCETWTPGTSSVGCPLVRSDSGTISGKQRAWAVFSYPRPCYPRLWPCFFSSTFPIKLLLLISTYFSIPLSVGNDTWCLTRYCGYFTLLA